MNTHAGEQVTEEIPDLANWRRDPGATECCAQAQMDSAARRVGRGVDLGANRKSGWFESCRAWLWP